MVGGGVFRTRDSRFVRCAQNDKSRKAKAKARARARARAKAKAKTRANAGLSAAHHEGQGRDASVEMTGFLVGGGVFRTGDSGFVRSR